MIPSPKLMNPDLPENVYIEENCPCTRSCPRHGNCFECVANHRDIIRKTPPACLRYMCPES